ncbi:MAG: glycoside hydrolase family 3 C-terminal domain-containing protein [Proteobacteria bacterium]|nr:glycoside hydrolase family 3 C-terminal domain-containing protein [Pseudomonadota bacterium]
MMDSMETHRSELAFDADAIHDGNRGLDVDDAMVALEVEALLGSMTLEQKLFELHGWQPQPIEGLYYAGGDESLGIAPFKMVDGPRGARAGTATAFPVAMARGASFNPMLERRVGLAAGLEVAARGGNVLLAPTINLLRHPGWGRAQETYSEDPFHLGTMGVAFVSGAQNHVLTSPKHFALNNLEITRFEASANIDARTLHEVYLPHFRRCVVEGAAASIMSAYNKMNGVYCGEHPVLLTDILRDDWGFKGFVESDWFLGTRSTAAAIHAGMDIEMPAAYRFEREKIDQALADGSLDETVINRNAGHVLHQKIAWDLANLPRPDESVVECEAHRELAREAAEQSFVLLKNPGLLPLSPDMKLAVIGDLADAINLGDRGSSFVTSKEVITPLKGLQNYSTATDITWFGSDASLASLGDYDFCIVVAGLTYREEGEFIPTQQQEAEGSELARGGDRADLRLPAEQEALIQAVAAQARQTLVLLEGGSAIEVSPWVDSVDALMMIWYPGCEGGNALARVLFGDVSPSGRLPVSFPRSVRQLMDWDINALDIPHNLYHGYRYLDHHGEEPQYPFGFGLGYTRFALDGLQVEREDNGLLVTLTVTNVGDRSGATVPQLYVSYLDSAVPRVPKELKGFGRVELEAGETVDLLMWVADSDLCFFDPSDGWTLEPCGYLLRAGFSSAALELESEWRFDGEDWEPR